MSRTARPVLLVAGLSLAIAALAACQPEPAATADPTSSGSAPASQTASPSASATGEPEAGIALPAACADIYSADMLAELEADVAPLNADGVELYATQQGALLELLAEVPTINCTWGPPGSYGISTNVSIIDEARSAEIIAELEADGFACRENDGATICEANQRGVTLDDEEYERGESHALRGDSWIATSWLNVLPAGYTEDIVATLWS